MADAPTASVAVDPADGRTEGEAAHGGRVGGRQPHGQHPAHALAHHVHANDPELPHQRERVGGELVDRDRGVGLGRA